MSKLEELRKAALAAEEEFQTTLNRFYPRADMWTFYRAEDKVREGTADKWDTEMATNPEILAAAKKKVEALHAFYFERDGEKGFLGSRGI